MTTKKVLCLHCLNEFTTREDRFPICKCGLTIPVVEGQSYAILNAASQSEPTEPVDEITDITIVTPKNTQTYPIAQYKKWLPAAIGLQVAWETSWEEILLTDYIEHREALRLYTAIELIQHRIYMQQSNVYAFLMQKGMYKAAHALLTDYDFHNCDSPELLKALENCEALKSPNDEELDNEEMIISIDAVLNGFPDVNRSILTAEKVSVSMLDDLLDHTPFTTDEIFKFLLDLQTICVRKSEAIHMIYQYAYYTEELERWFGIKYNNDHTFHANLHTAKTTYRMYENNGLLAFRKYVYYFKDKYPVFNYGDYQIKMLNNDDAASFPLGLLPKDNLLSPVIGVFHKGVLITMIVQSDVDVKIHGAQQDSVKIAVNAFLDYIEQQVNSI